MCDKKDESFSDEMDRLMRESEEREKNMTPEEKEALQKARRRHARKVRIEMQGYDKHPDEKIEDVFKDEKKKDDNENQS